MDETGDGLKSFRTLRGFLSGEEPAEEDFFFYSATLRITSESLDFDDINHHLGLHPTHSHRKGDRPGPRSPGFEHDMWSYSPQLDKGRPLEEHIDALWKDIKQAKDYLLSLKIVSHVDVFLGYNSNVDTAGIEVPYTCLEMFIALEIPFGISIIIA